MIELGTVCELTRYPVKSMAGVTTDSAFLGWHGLDGDRRFAFRRLGDGSGFPWLTASKLPELLLYHPIGLDNKTGEPLPTQVRTPAGKILELHSAELQNEIAERFHGKVELLQLKHGIFDDASISVISPTTMDAIGRSAGMELDRRRFRANIVLKTIGPKPFLEDEWIGGTLLFGDRDPKPAVTVTARDIRCVMINLDPETGVNDPRVMKTVVELNQNNAGVYGTVVQTGVIQVGQSVHFIPTARDRQ